MKILCDQMLGSLATWLRFMGIDTYYATDTLHDDTILNIAQRERRILITKDKELILRAEKKNIPVIPIHTTDLDEQLRKVTSTIPIDKHRFLTRCSLCNTPLQSIDKQQVKHAIPSKVFDHHKEFLICPHCNKIYWKGSHYDDILKKINKIQ